jgi:bifunctional N-acetylglucosamine-1-phosphate-uridyltransferase/glucosamine-1-phosphate-acetyltransferase GlmU-like protein
VITRDVPSGALAVERASQVDVPGYAARRRETKQARDAEEPKEA